MSSLLKSKFGFGNGRESRIPREPAVAESIQPIGASTDVLIRSSRKICLYMVVSQTCLLDLSNPRKIAGGDKERNLP